jgi:predicted transcriptional regulator
MKKFLKQVFTHTGSTNLRDLLQILTNMGTEYDDSILEELDSLIEEGFIVKAHTNISGVYYRIKDMDSEDHLEKKITGVVELLESKFKDTEFTTNTLHKAQQDEMGLSKVTVARIVEDLLDSNSIEVKSVKKYMGREYKVYRVKGTKKK